MKELSDLFPTEKEIEIGKSKVKIKNIALGDIPVVAEIVGKAMGLFSVKGKDELVIKKDELLKFIANDFNSVVNLLSVTTDLEIEVIKKLNIAAASTILISVFKENASFFSQQVAPMIKEATKDLGQSQGAPPYGDNNIAAGLQ